MTIFKPSLFAIATLLTLGLHAIPAQATALRTFLSSAGNDANTASNCAATTPCRTLAAAFSVTQANGHIFMKDVAGYGSLTITRAVTLVAIDGALIGVPSGGTGITIAAGANDDITIDGLIIDGAGVGQIGILFYTGKSLTVTKSVVRGLSSGIYFQPGATSALQISNSVVTKNNGGIIVLPVGTGAVATASLSRVEIYNNATQGLLVDGNTCSSCTINTVVADSVVANSGTGYWLHSSTSTVSRLTLIRSVAAHNTIGLLADGLNATLRVGQSILTGNNTSWSATNSAVLRSYADNNIDGNNDGDPTPTPIVKK